MPRYHVEFTRPDGLVLFESVMKAASDGTLTWVRSATAVAER